MSRSLTLAKLGEYDDLLTDLLIDKVYYWTQTHKADRVSPFAYVMIETDLFKAQKPIQPKCQNI